MARVLLVDDDIAEISAVKRVLARAGHQPVLATNANDALASAAQVTPDLLVVGSTCEGGEALRRIAEDGGASAIPLVVIGESGDSPAEAAQVARPVDPAQLAEQVAASLAAAARPQSPQAPAPPAPARRAGARPQPNGPTDGAAARRAAAEALRARAEELRRAAAPPVAAAPPAEPALPPEAAPPPAEEPPAPSLDLEDGGLEAILRRAEEAERAHAAERKARARQADRATVEAAQRAEAERLAIEKAARARSAEQRVRTEERARADAERRAQAEAAARARAEEERSAIEERARTEVERARADAERRARAEVAARERAEEEHRAAEERARREAEEEARRAAEAEERARRAAEGEARRASEAEQRARAGEKARRAAEAKARAEAEARRRAEAERHAVEERARRGVNEEARRAAEAEERARAEAEARRKLEEELERLRGQVETERRSAEERIHSVLERAAAEERAAEDLRRQAEEEARKQLEEDARRRQAEEEELRAAIASARAEMEALRRKGEEEARRRAEAEAEILRLARDAERRAAEAAAQPPPFDLPVYRPPHEEPAPDPAEDAVRRRVAALRQEQQPPAPSPAPLPEPAPLAAVAEEPPRPIRPPPAELRGGTLADVPAPRLLALAARAAMSGRLDVEGEVARSLWLEEGRVVGAASADPTERVEDVALKLGLVTREQHRQIAPAAGTLPTRRAALLLLERGFLKPTELTAVVRRRTEEVVFGTFADAGARFRWAAEGVPAEERTVLERGALALAVEGVRRRWLAPQVDAVLGGSGTLLSPIATGPSVQDLALSPDERRVVALADGLRTLDEIVAASPLDALSTRQVLAALVLVGSLAVRVFQGGRPAAVASAAIDLARVREKLDQVRRADYFTILGVSRLCTPHEVRQAAERLFAEFEPRRFQGIQEEGLQGRLDEILRVVADAREILVDDRLRSEYLRGLGEER